MAVGGLALAGDVRRVWAQAAGGKVALDVRHPDLHTLIAPEAPLTRIAGGLGFTEGPVWRGTVLLFSDIPNKRIVRWRRLPEGPELTTYATGSSNGLTLDRHGQVLAAEHDGRRVTRVTEDGTRTVLAERFQGKRLNSPNDLVVKSDGALYFTDPPYGVHPPHARCATARGLVVRAHPGQRAERQWCLPLDPGRHLAPRGGRLRAPQWPGLRSR
jgi:sugar lactone lactonase YvrE